LGEYQRTLLLFGSGRYRSSDVYLAAMPLAEIESGRPVRFYAGLDGNGKPIWSWREEEAAPLFCAGCVGELSARWNPQGGRWLLLYNSDNPRGIVVRSAVNPWGRWSRPALVFDPGGVANQYGGYGDIMHMRSKDTGGLHDFVFDDIVGGDWDRWGGEYGPYQ